MVGGEFKREEDPLLNCIMATAAAKGLQQRCVTTRVNFLGAFADLFELQQDGSSLQIQARIPWGPICRQNIYYNTLYV